MERQTIRYQIFARWLKDNVINLTIYTKKECHLCDIAKETLIKLMKEFPFSLTEIDIEKDMQAYEKYRYLIPVLEMEGRIISTYKINEDELKNLLKLRLQ